MKNHTIAGIRIPDSQLARKATQLVRELEGDLLFHHSMRVFFWSALKAKRANLKCDPELLFVGAMFHDLGLTDRYHDSLLRFEVDGANAARDFLRENNVPDGDIEKTWTAIALHTTPGIPEHMHPEIALIQAGAGTDIAGRGYEEIPENHRHAVLTAFPRGPEFEIRIIEAFYAGLKHRPQTTFGTFNDDFISYKDPAFHREDLCKIIMKSPWTHRAG